MEVNEKINQIMESQILETQKYDVQDMTFRFDLEYFLDIISEKLTEISVFTGDMSENFSYRVNGLKWEPEDKKFWVEVTLQEEKFH